MEVDFPFSSFHYGRRFPWSSLRFRGAAKLLINFCLNIEFVINSIHHIFKYLYLVLNCTILLEKCNQIIFFRKLCIPNFVDLFYMEWLCYAYTGRSIISRVHHCTCFCSCNCTIVFSALSTYFEVTICIMKADSQQLDLKSFINSIKSHKLFCFR